MKHELVLVGNATGMKADAKQELLSGFYNNFAFHIKRDLRQRRFIVCTWVTAPDQTAEDNLNLWLNSYGSSQPQYLAGVYDPTKHLVSVYIALNSKDRQGTVDFITRFLGELTSYLSSLRCICGCETCGSTMDTAIYQMGATTVFRCGSCFDAMSQEALASRQAVQGNVVAGAVGAFLFGLGGAAVWVFIDQLGYVAGITGLVTVILAFKGYEIFGKKLNNLGIVICCIISLFMGVVAIYFTMGLDVFNELEYAAYGYNLMDALRDVPGYLAFPEIRNAYLGNLLMGYLFMVLGAFSTVVTAIKTNRSGLAFQKLAQNPRSL